MKTVSLFVWGSCFKTWIIHNHLGNLRWNVPPLYDQVSKVSRSRSRKGHRSHKLCCQPPPDSGVSDAGPSLWAALSRCIPHNDILPLSPQSWLSLLVLRQTPGGRRGAKCRPQSHPETRDDNKTCEAVSHIWPIRGQRWGQVTNERPWRGQWGPGVPVARSHHRRLRQVPLRLRLSQLWSSDSRGHRQGYHELRIPDTGHRHSLVSTIKINTRFVNWQLSVVMYRDQQKPDK